MKSVWHFLANFYASSIGKKAIVALTGLVLVGFLVGHLAGNLLVFQGPEATNAYAHKLQGLGPLLWAARLGLLAAVGLHIVATVHLTAQNRAARPETYLVDATLRASRSSKIMLWSGLTIAAFVIYHLMHFTWGTFNRFREPDGPYVLADGRPDVYRMVVDGFREPGNSFFYAIALGLLCSHLTHGVPSVFQTLGLTSPGSRKFIQGAGVAFAILLFAGYLSIPVSVLLGWLH
jgi:succinate dehydrogenase cytochrome b subunit